ncbi:MAG: 30S ribosomal protein S6 [Chloroflexota bacterium]
MRTYELMWILGSAADADVRQASLDAVSELIGRHGGETDRLEFWGRRTLAYPIRHNKEGSYLLAQFQMDPQAAKEFERDLKLDQSIIRHLLIRLDEEELRAAEVATAETEG